MAKKLDYKYCKAAPMLEWLGNKWALVVLMKISENGPVRFNGCTATFRWYRRRCCRRFSAS